MSDTGYGVAGTSNSNLGIYGWNWVSRCDGYIGGPGIGVYGGGCGAKISVLGRTDTGTAIEGQANTGYAGYFEGKVEVHGDFTVSGGTKNFAIGYRVGWHGRYGGGLIGPAGVITDYGMPLIINAEAALPIVAAPRYHVVTFGPCFTSRGYPEGKEPPGPWSRLADRCWFGLVATLGLSAQLEFNPVEFVDFVVGFTTLDLLGDDPWQPKEEPKEQ